MSRNQHSTNEQRLAWLRARPELWRAVKLMPDQSLVGWFVSRADHERIARAMKDAGLFSAKTYDLDIRVPRFVKELQEENK